MSTSALDTPGLTDDSEALDDLVTLVDRLAQAQEAARVVLAAIDERLGRIEEKIADYEPLIEMVRQRADRGSVWRRNRGESG